MYSLINFLNKHIPSFKWRDRPSPTPLLVSSDPLPLTPCPLPSITCDSFFQSSTLRKLCSLLYLASFVQHRFMRFICVSICNNSWFILIVVLCSDLSILFWWTWGCFHFGTIRNSANLDILVYVFWWLLVCITAGCEPRSRITGPWSMCILNFSRYSKQFTVVVVLIYIPSSNKWVFAHNLTNTWLCSPFSC